MAFLDPNPSYVTGLRVELLTIFTIKKITHFKAYFKHLLQFQQSIR